jgi:hypothetical protein
MSDPKLTITIPKADYDDLSNGLYKLHFTKQVTDDAKNPLGVWAYKALDKLSKDVTGKSEGTREGIEN